MVVVLVVLVMVVVLVVVVVVLVMVVLVVVLLVVVLLLVVVVVVLLLVLLLLVCGGRGSVGLRTKGLVREKEGLSDALGGRGGGSGPRRTEKKGRVRNRQEKKGA